MTIKWKNKNNKTIIGQAGVWLFQLTKAQNNIRVKTMIKVMDINPKTNQLQIMKVKRLLQKIETNLQVAKHTCNEWLNQIEGI